MSDSFDRLDTDEAFIIPHVDIIADYFHHEDVALFLKIKNYKAKLFRLVYFPLYSQKVKSYIDI